MDNLIDLISLALKPIGDEHLLAPPTVPEVHLRNCVGTDDATVVQEGLPHLQVDAFSHSLSTIALQDHFEFPLAALCELSSYATGRTSDPEQLERHYGAFLAAEWQGRALLGTNSPAAPRDIVSVCLSKLAAVGRRGSIAPWAASDPPMASPYGKNGGQAAVHAGGVSPFGSASQFATSGSASSPPRRLWHPAATSPATEPKAAPPVTSVALGKVTVSCTEEGLISSTALRDALTTLGYGDNVLSEDVFRTLFDDADMDGDGFVTLDEARQFLTEFGELA